MLASNLLQSQCLFGFFNSMSFIARQEPFTCEHCNEAVNTLHSGSYRNHCPQCLYSKHVDANIPGDRASSCRGLMRPDHIDQDGKRGFTVVHICEKCGKSIPNKTAPDDKIIEFMERKADACNEF